MLFGSSFELLLLYCLCLNFAFVEVRPFFPFIARAQLAGFCFIIMIDPFIGGVFAKIEIVLR